MNTCPTVKEVTMPGCYSGVLKVNTGLAPGTLVWFILEKQGALTGGESDEVEVDANGDIEINPRARIDYFNSYKLRIENIGGNPLTIKGYDCYRLLPVKNANEVVDVVI